MPLHPEENDLAFLQEMQDVKPIKQGDKVFIQQSSTTLAQALKRQALEREQRGDRNFLSVERVDPVDPYDMLSYKKDGVQHGVFKKLRLGKYHIDSVLNLQQHKIDQAREAFFDAVSQAHSLGVRTMLVQHGLGLKSKPVKGLMKSYVKQWLLEMPQVIAFHSALGQHGGLAAAYVLLNKNDSEKQHNRELHRKR